MSDWGTQVIEPVERLIEGWTSGNNNRALGLLLPAWRSNFGLTDGWVGVLEAVRTAADSDAVPADDRVILWNVADCIQAALDHR